MSSRTGENAQDKMNVKIEHTPSTNLRINEKVYEEPFKNSIEQEGSSGPQSPPEKELLGDHKELL